MKHLSKVLFLMFLATFLVAESAFALAVNTRPASPLGASAEPGLQEILDTVVGTNQINAITDQSPVALWVPGAEGGTSAYTVSMFTAGSGVLGIYGADGTTKDLFSTLHPDGTPWSDGGMQEQNMAVDFIVRDNGVMINNIIYSGDFSSFGFYWNSSFTEDDMNGVGVAKALTYNVKDGMTIDTNAYGNNPFINTVNAVGNDDWILAFEDGTDNDFQDAIFYMEDLTPAPEPASLALLGLGLLGLAGIGRKKYAKK